MESLIFDIDGTLWDSRALVAEGYNLQLHDEGLDDYATNPEELKALFGKTMGEIADALFAPIPAGERYSLMERCMARENRYLQENPCAIGYPGVRQTLEALAKTHRLFLVSNSQKGYPELCMEKLGLTHLFSGHLCYGDTQAPKGVTIQMLMQRHGIRSACYIGDTQGDLEAARFAGIPFVWARYGFGTPEEWEWEIAAPGDLLTLVKEDRL